MADNKTYAARLLDEFGDICSNKGIEYELTWGPVKIGAGVIMSAEDAAEFIDAINVQHSDNRVIECWNNSRAYPNSTIRYVGTDSICYNILDYTNYEYHGIFIEINIRRAAPESIGEKIRRAQEREIARHSYSFKSRSSGAGSSRDELLYKWGMRLHGGEAGLRKKCFDNILRGKESDLSAEQVNKIKPVKYSQEYIDYCIVFEDLSLDDIGGEEGLLKALAGDSLARVRDDKSRLDRLRVSNAPNFKTAREAWEIVKQVDEEIKQEIKQEAADGDILNSGVKSDISDEIPETTGGDS